MKSVQSTLTLVLLSLAVLSSCSINKMATSMVADAVASPQGSSVFSSDGDPELVKDALPFALKMYESLLQSNPENRDLLEATAEGFISYANAFIHTPAGMLEYRQLDRQKEMLHRARNMYLRGRDYALRSLEVEYPGFRAALKSGEGSSYLKQMEAGDLRGLYWAAAGWMGAVSAAGFDMGLLMELPRPVALAACALEIDPQYKQGALHSLMLEIYGGIPDVQMLFGTSEVGTYAQASLDRFYSNHSFDPADNNSAAASLERKARFHFNQAVELSEGHAVGPYVALAGSIAVKNQDAQEYRRLLKKALSIEVDKYPEMRLENTILQEKARWMLEHIEDKFLVLD
ncbi:MAG: TRAP transporter TatT component family protein [Spirochaetia bacterium]|nr:TRAP transporter TatT component family protein [Spirochaetia bacterium]